MQCHYCSIINDFRLNFVPASSYRAYHGGLADRAVPGFQLLGLMLVAFLATDVGLINFNRTVKQA